MRGRACVRACVCLCASVFVFVRVCTHKLVEDRCASMDARHAQGYMKLFVWNSAYARTATSTFARHGHICANRKLIGCA